MAKFDLPISLLLSDIHDMKEFQKSRPGLPAENVKKLRVAIRRCVEAISELRKAGKARAVK